MHPTLTSADRHRDDRPHIAGHPRPLHRPGTSPSRPPRAGGHTGHRRWRGNRIDLHQRADGRPIALHPAEPADAASPASRRRHLSCTTAHPHGDGSNWCPVPRAGLCPQRTLTCRTPSNSTGALSAAPRTPPLQAPLTSPSPTGTLRPLLRNEG
ncbi:DUF6083 domain-containing protein [Streptomyces sp. Tue6028]|uniref:DUF6083 domain-containing protein n=1 Tax=Streptomyces sp. Tue6028 TaxID=2036037 RepID=UPI003EBDA245